MDDVWVCVCDAVDLVLVASSSSGLDGMLQEFRNVGSGSGSTTTHWRYTLVFALQSFPQKSGVEQTLTYTLPRTASMGMDGCPP